MCLGHISASTVGTQLSCDSIITTLWGPGEGNPWTEEPGGLQSVGSQRVGYDLVSRPPPPHFGVVLK